MAMVTYEDASRATDELVRMIQGKLQQWTGITPDCVIKGGSLGHGTAIPGEFDLDLVIYSRDIGKERLAGAAGDRRPFNEWLTKIRAFLVGSLGADITLSSDDFPHAIRFTYKGKIDVDLLVSPVWEKPQDFFYFLTRDIQDRKKRFSFSVGASKWQVEFYSHQPPQVMEYARRAKAWRNKMWPKGRREGKPKSYFLSLLVLRAHEIAKKTAGPAIIDQQTTSELKKLVKDHKKLDIYWEKYYNLVSGIQSAYYYSTHYDENVDSVPRLLDPANPYNNMYHTGIGPCNTRTSDYEEGDGNWALLVAYIDTVDLTQPI